MSKLKLTKVGKHKIEVIKLIRLFTELGLKESKELMDNVPSILISYKEDIKIEQIIKNFEAIGAAVEEVKDAPPPKIDVVGTDNLSSLERPGTAKKMSQDYIKKETKTTTYKKSEFTNKTDISKKLKLKPAIFFAITIAVIKSFSSIYFGFFAFFYVVFIVAIGIAYLLRRNNINAEKQLGIPAFLITILYFFSLVVADWIILYIMHQYVISINIFGLIISLFTSRNILVLVAAALSYFLATNKNVFKQFLPQKIEIENNEIDFVENKGIKNHKEKKRF